MTIDVTQAAFSQLLISGTFVHETSSFEEFQQRLGIIVRPQLVMIVSIDRYPNLSHGKPFSWRTEIGQQLVAALHDAMTVPFLWVWTSEGVLAVLVELRAEEQAHLAYKDKSLQLAKQIQQHADDRGFAVSVGIGSYHYDNPFMLHYSYEEAKESMMERFFQGNRLIFLYEKRKSSDKTWKKVISQEEKAELLARVRVGDLDGSVAFLKILLEQLAQSYRHSVDMFKSEVFELMMSLSRFVLEMGGDATEILSENARVIQDLYHTIRYDNFVGKLCDYWRKFGGQAARANAPEVSPVLRSALTYMKENMNDKVSLERVAQYCYISTYHFAHLFKKQMGLSFIDYLNKMRIEKAVHYLEATELPVQEIAGRVGFQDANYFSRKFKQRMHCSPTEYRAAKLS